MANLKALKNRIKSVKSTQKITKAMKMVSASKLRRARERAEAAAPYAERMERMLVTLASNVSKSSAPQLLVGNGKDDVHLVVVVTTDRGLCGGFNTHVTRAARHKIQALKHAGKTVKIFCIGRKGYDLLKGSYSKDIIEKVFDISKKRQIPFSDSENQATKIIKMFEDGEFDVCSVFYNKFLSAIAQKPVEQQLIPLSMEGKEQKADVVYEYEPSEEKILADLLPRNIAVQIYHSMLESSASEHGARMTAMDNATRNAGEMIKKLTLVYNRTRQAVITKELIEIISGAEAI